MATGSPSGTGKSNIQEVYRLACDSTKAGCPIGGLYYVKHLQQKGETRTFAIFGGSQCSHIAISF
jgi:hypothetical protein